MSATLFLSGVAASFGPLLLFSGAPPSSPRGRHRPVGPNGAGKTTLLRIVAGEHAPMPAWSVPHRREPWSVTCRSSRRRRPTRCWPTRACAPASAPPRPGSNKWLPTWPSRRTTRRRPVSPIVTTTPWPAGCPWAAPTWRSGSPGYCPGCSSTSPWTGPLGSLSGGQAARVGLGVHPGQSL